MQPLLMIFTVVTLAFVARVSGLAAEDRRDTDSAVTATTAPFALEPSTAENAVAAPDR